MLRTKSPKSPTAERASAMAGRARGDRSAIAEGLVRLGVIIGPHGVRGAVRVRSDTARPHDLTAYGQLSDGTGARRFDLTIIGEGKGHLLARVAGVDDREAAEALRGTELCVARTALPEPEAEEYYHVDLIGLAVQRADGTTLGRVGAIHDHGAGDVMEVMQPDGEAVFVPFTRAVVQVVDLERGRLILSEAAEEGVTWL